MAGQQNLFDSSNLIVYIYKWRKPLIINCLIAIIAASIFSGPYFITPKYRSEVVMFPTTTNSVSKALLNDQPGGSEDIMEFGKEEEAEQMLQVLNSEDIRSKVVDKFDLLTHYDINENAKFKQTELFQEYRSNISFRRTQYMSVVVSVLDKDPELAAEMANFIAAYYDTVSLKIKSIRAKEGLSIVEAQYAVLQSEIQTLEDSLKSLRKLGVHDYEAQSTILSEQLALAKIESKSSVAKELQEQLDVLAEYGGTYTNLRDRLGYLKSENSSTRKKLIEARVNVTQSLPAKFVVSNAFPAEKKDYPVRWLIVVLAFVGTFLVTLIGILILDSVRKAKA